MALPSMYMQQEDSPGNLTVKKISQQYCELNLFGTCENTILHTYTYRYYSFHGVPVFSSPTSRIT